VDSIEINIKVYILLKYSECKGEKSIISDHFLFTVNDQLRMDGAFVVVGLMTTLFIDASHFLLRDELLARRPRPGVHQAGSVSSSVSGWPHTTVPVRLLYPSRQCCHLVASAFHQPTATCCTLLPSQHLRLPCLFSFRPHSLELSPGFHPWLGHQSVSDICLKRIWSLNASAFNALGGPGDYCIYLLTSCLTLTGQKPFDSVI